MNKLLSLFILLLLPTVLLAQNRAAVKGTVIDSTSKTPIERVTVAIVNSKDTSLISYTLTQKDGTFKLSGIPSNRETKLIVSVMGYQTFRKELMLKPNETLDIGQVLLNTKTLNEVVIKGERSPITMRKDTIEFNTEAFKTRPNAVVEDLLRQLPGVQVNYDGTILVDGKEVSKLLLDGKRFFGNDPKVASKNLDADMIDKVQIYEDRDDDPDHKLSSVEVKKIINLKMKKKLKKSTLGKIYGGMGTRDRYEVGGILSSFRDTLQLSVIGLGNNLNKTGFSTSDLNSMGGFNRSGGSQTWDGTFGGRGWSGLETVTSTGFNINNDYGEKLKMNLVYFFTKTTHVDTVKAVTEQTLPTTLLTSKENYISHREEQKHSIGGLLEWKPDTLRKLRYEPKLEFDPQSTISSGQDFSFNTQSPKLSESTSNSSQKRNSTSFSHSFSFYKRLKKKGESITINHELSLGKNGSDDFSYDNLTSYTAGLTSQILDRFNDNDQKSNSGAVSVTYNYPISKKFSLEMLSNTRYYSNTDKSFVYDKNTLNGQYDLFLPDQSSNLMRTIFVQNLKPTLSYDVNKKMTIRFGLDNEIQHVKNKFNSTVGDIGKSYYFLFPTLKISGEGFSADYYESIEHPQISQMAPITRVYNQLYKFIGNPDLVPSRLHYLTGNFYNYNNDKQINTNLYGGLTLTENNIVSKNTIDAVGATTATTVNQGNGWRTYLGAGFGKQFKKTQFLQISLNTDLNLNYNRAAFFLNADAGKQSDYGFRAGQGISFNFNSLISLNAKYDINATTTRYSGVNYNTVNILQQTIGSDFSLRWPSKVVFDAQYGYNFSNQVVQGFPKSSNVVNLAVTLLMLKKDRGQLKLSVYDLLDQNISVSRYASTNSVTTFDQQILKRYFMITYQLKLTSYK
jgi:hypothetical protein